MVRSDARRMTNVPPPPGTTLFLIGMRVSKPWRVRAWLSVFLAMIPMLAHLRRNRDAGMLSYHLYALPSPLIVSYWRSDADIRRFAADAGAPHHPAWLRFNKKYADTNSVGIWHETYVIGEHETIAGGMPPWGLAGAVGGREIGAGDRTAAQRIVQSVN